MRNIELRGKRNDNNEWAFGFYFEKDGCSYIIKNMPNVSLADPEFAVGVCPESVGQYTGLKDKNGVKVFEGDIVKNKYGNVGKIVFEGVSFKISWKEREMSDSILVWLSKLEVIGNPELLETKP